MQSHDIRHNFETEDSLDSLAQVKVFKCGYYYANPQVSLRDDSQGRLYPERSC